LLGARLAAAFLHLLAPSLFQALAPPLAATPQLAPSFRAHPRRV
jgi:hypothetical protein